MFYKSSKAFLHEDYKTSSQRRQRVTCCLAKTIVTAIFTMTCYYVLLRRNSATDLLIFDIMTSTPAYGHLSLYLASHPRALQASDR